MKDALYLQVVVYGKMQLIEMPAYYEHCMLVHCSCHNQGPPDYSTRPPDYRLVVSKMNGNITLEKETKE